MKIIPVFIPHAGCPYRCIYCNQHRISGTAEPPSPQKVHSIVKRHLRTMRAGENVEIAFFGGTFTLLPERLQTAYLKAVYPYIKNGVVSSVRMSTHPETVSRRAMIRFKRYGGRLVELGVQSLDREVLRRSRRGAGIETVIRASDCIKNAGLEWGVQVMIGLPGDTLEKSISTAEALVKLRPKTARIYPAVVIKGTELAEKYRKGKYRSLSIDDAVAQASEVADVFENGGVRVIRIGLHPSRDLDNGSAFAGPYHPAFGGMVRSRRIRNRLLNALGDKDIPNRSRIEVYAPRDLHNLITGHKGAEREFLQDYFGVPVVLHSSSPLWAKPDKRGNVVLRDIRKNLAVIDPRIPEEAKEKLQQLNYYLLEVPLHKRLRPPVKAHVDMMMFRYGETVIYENSLEDIACILRKNGYECVKGERINACGYPQDILYNACAIGNRIIHYRGRIEKHIRTLRLRHIEVAQGYARCSVIPVDRRHIITSDRGIKEAWESSGGVALFIRQGYVKLPGYNTGFIGGASGVTDSAVLFTGSLKMHPDARSIRDFIKKTGKGIIELYDGPLYDGGALFLFEVRPVIKTLSVQN